MVEGIRKNEGRGVDGREVRKIMEMDRMRKKGEGKKKNRRQIKPRRKWERKRSLNYNKRT